MKSKELIILVILLLFNISVSSQNIVGKVVDGHSKEPLPFANVVLLQAEDSSFVKGVITDEIGTFSVETSSNNNYLLRINYLGYKTYTMEINQIDLGIIQLLAEEQLLNGVTVTAPLKIFKMENGGISTNIQNSRLKEIGTASDVLSQLPFVTKNGDGFTVFGKGTPMIYINNHLVRSITELEELNSANIKKVTIITNPGAEYNATANAIIKIETVKISGEGLGGSTTGNVIFDRKTSHNELVNLNYRIKNFDMFGMIRFAELKDRDYQNLDQITNFNQKTVLTNQNTTANKYRKNIRTNIGFNYLFGKNNSIGMKYELTDNPKNRVDMLSVMNVYKNDVLLEKYNSFMNNYREVNSHYINVYYSGNPLSWLAVKFDMDYTNGKNTNDQYVLNFYSDSTEYIKTNSFQSYDLYASKLTLATPVGDGKLTYGGEYAHTYNKQNFDTNELGNTTILLSNSNKVQQNLFAAFASFNKTFGQFSTDIGFRYENIGFDYFVRGEKNDAQSRIYSNLFPNAGITYLGEKFQMTLSYRNTVSRPSYYQLRNSIQYDNPYTYESGNPYLKPTRISSLSYLLLWKNLKFITNYDTYRDNILFLSEQYLDDVVLMRPINLDKSQKISTSVSYSTTFGTWKPTLELGVSKGFIKYNNETYNKPYYMSKLKNNIILFKDLQIGADVAYSTNGNRDIFYIQELFIMDVYLSKSFMKGKLRINLNGSDIFNTRQQKTSMVVNNIATKIRNNLNTRGVTLSISYRFNVTKSKYKGENASDEINRF